MRSTLFEWAEHEGIRMADLAERLGYSERHLWRIKAGDSPVTQQFMARVVLHLGEWARSLFLPEVSVDTDTM